MLFVGQIVAASCLACFAAVAVLVVRAPNGWEDADGFHTDDDPRLRRLCDVALDFNEEPHEGVNSRG